MILIVWLMISFDIFPLQKVDESISKILTLVVSDNLSIHFILEQPQTFELVLLEQDINSFLKEFDSLIDVNDIH